jgi:Asp-tRNA(Asn)/Glu-tRNA(Gln) amidotransferase A subunit family amidase
MPLAELAAAVSERRVSSAELVGASLERIDRLDGPVNAVVLVRGDDALADAAAIDERVAAGSDPGPLPGLPLLVKDNEHVAGLPTTYASLTRKDAPPAERDCEEVARLRAAGAVIVGKTNLPEFAFEGVTTNRLFGDTRNPWALDWSPGGSSGGSGAALMMGLAPLATGTDGGGSIRIPAAFCGLVGLKPTAGLIGHDPTPSWIDFSTKGPLALTIADARLLLDVLRGPLPGDPTAVPMWTPREGPWPARLLAAPRLSAYGPLPDSIGERFERAVAALEAATGLIAERVEPPFSPAADEDWFTAVAVEELAWVGRGVLDRLEDLTPHMRDTFEYAATVSAHDYAEARFRRYEMVKVLDHLLGEDAVLVSPTMCVEGFYADGRSPGQEPGPTPSHAYNTQQTNMTGHPSLSVPAGTSPNAVPFGIQITGPRFADDLVLAVGAAWEAANPWPVVAPGYEAFEA